MAHTDLASIEAEAFFTHRYPWTLRHTLSTDTQEKPCLPLLFVAAVLCPGLFTTSDICKRGQSYVREFTFLLPAKTGWRRISNLIMRDGYSARDTFF